MAFTVGGIAQSVKKLSRSEAVSAVVSKVQPDYPPMARQLKIQGAVEVEATLSENGQVESVTIVSGNPVLTKPVVEAVKKWKFTPQTQDGKPVRAIAPVTVNFSL
jgi:protein TonB